MFGQTSLFDAEPVQLGSLEGLEPEDLGQGAWLAYRSRWLRGDRRLYERLVREQCWRASRRRMYDRIVDVPRLFATPESLPRVLREAQQRLSARFRPLPSVTMAWYRDGRDSVAMHGDRLGDAVADSVVAILSLGTPRRFLLRPRGGGASRSWQVGWGDLLVMGGSCQRFFEHGVPKGRAEGGRIAVMFRSVPPGPAPSRPPDS